MGQPDMRTPIAYALSYPERITCGVKPLNFPALSNLEFNPVDYQRFPCLKLAIDACYQGQGATTALNAANEVAVAAFLNQQIKFTDIAIVNEQVLSSLSTTQASSLELILEVDRQARNSAQNIIKQQRHIKRMY